MSDADPPELGLLPKLVIAFAMLLAAAGTFWHGVTLENAQRFWGDLVDRRVGRWRSGSFCSRRWPRSPRSAMVASDARTGRSPYFWTVLSNPRERVARLREGLNATARIILLGLAMDVIYQLIELKTFYPVEALIVALLLAFLPYLLIRGPVARIVRR
jgi:hypothetical protein